MPYSQSSRADVSVCLSAALRSGHAAWYSLDRNRQHGAVCRANNSNADNKLREKETAPRRYLASCCGGKNGRRFLNPTKMFLASSCCDLRSCFLAVGYVRRAAQLPAYRMEHSVPAGTFRILLSLSCSCLRSCYWIFIVKKSDCTVSCSAHYILVLSYTVAR